MQFKAEQVGAPDGVARTTLLVPLLVLLLMTFGLIVLWSAGYSMSSNPNVAVTRQLVYAPLALLLGWLAWRSNLDRVRELRWPLFGLVIALLLLARTPGIGRMVNGSWRWIDLGLFRIQPSDLAKVVLVLLLADHIARCQRRTLPIAGPTWRFTPSAPYLALAPARWADLREGFLRPVGVLLAICGGIALGPDLGTIVLCCVVAYAMLFVGGARLSYLGVTLALGSVAFTFLVLNWGSRLRRFLSFLDPEGRQADESYQLFQGMLAFACGGLTGVGPGNGLQQRAYLPEAHTDFVFTIIGEEWGLVATAAVAGVYFAVFWLVLRELRRATDLFRMSLALGCVLFLTLQALVNMCVVTGLLPTKGIALPFVSYGGTNLVTSAILVGLMLNALRDGGRPPLRPAVLSAP